MIFAYVKGSFGGFTILELAVVILIIGILTAGTLAIVKPLLIQAQYRATDANINRVIDVISAYAQRNHRIPCPANPDGAAAAQPFGAEVGSGVDGDRVGDCDNPAGGERVEGIVPFRTLGLSLDDVQDGYGRFLTYAVSPAFARDTTQSLGAHKRCRVIGKWVEAGDSRNSVKARFCCPDLGVPPMTDLAINDNGGEPLWPFWRDASGGSYDAADVAFSSAATFDLAADNVTAVAFVLVSHGSNGFGAFSDSGTRLPTLGNAPGAGELENANGNNTYISAARDDVFDDLVRWRTQDQIYAETGAGSCAFP